MFSLTASEDRWNQSSLQVRHHRGSFQVPGMISEALTSGLTSPSRDEGVLVGYFPAAQASVAVSVMGRPTRRTDKTFLFSVLAERQEIQERLGTHRAIQYLLVASSVMHDIQVYGGIEAFFEAMQSVAFGVFVNQGSLLTYFPLKPDSITTMMGGSGGGQSTNHYSTPKFIANKLAEIGLSSIGEIGYA